MTISGRHIQDDALVIVDGHGVAGNVKCAGEIVTVELATLPSVGMHFLQIQNSNGLFSNDFIFHVMENADAVAEYQHHLEDARTNVNELLAQAILRGNFDEVKRLLAGKAKINSRRPQGGSTPLSTAAIHDQLEIAKFLIASGARIDETNEDGNTPLHVAAFFCQTEFVNLLLDSGSSVLIKNKRGETPIDVVSAPWSQPLADFYIGLGTAIGIKLDLDQIQHARPKLAKLLEEHAAVQNAKSPDNNK